MDRSTEWPQTHPVRWGSLCYTATRPKITDYRLIEAPTFLPLHLLTVSSKFHHPFQKIFGPVRQIPNNTLRDATMQHVVHEWSVQCKLTSSPISSIISVHAFRHSYIMNNNISAKSTKNSIFQQCESESQHTLQRSPKTGASIPMGHAGNMFPQYLWRGDVHGNAPPPQKKNFRSDVV